MTNPMDDAVLAAVQEFYDTNKRARSFLIPEDRTRVWVATKDLNEVVRVQGARIDSRTTNDALFVDFRGSVIEYPMHLVVAIEELRCVNLWSHLVVYICPERSWWV